MPRRVRESLALALMMTRYWLNAHPVLRADMRAWQRRAAAIPDPALRANALTTLSGERLNAAGAALFATLVRRPDPALLHALIAFQITWDYVDTLAEQPADDPIANGAQLHAALADALMPGGSRTDYYRLHRARDDGGYLDALVDACRAGCAELPAYAHVRSAALSEARRATVQAVNHAPARVREPALHRWALAQDMGAVDIRWFELAAAASSSLAIHALLAAAADPDTTSATVGDIHGAYFPWICGLSTLLDSLVDEREDELSGEVSFVAYYGSRVEALERVSVLARRSSDVVSSLPHDERHAVVVAGMVAMYLSKTSAWTRGARPLTLAVLRASGAATLPLLALMRAWRMMRRAAPHRDAAEIG
jgi:tetraprenyl-beta-curcumene synthase